GSGVRNLRATTDIPYGSRSSPGARKEYPLPTGPERARGGTVRMGEAGHAASSVTRRQFLVRCGVLAALAEVPGLLALSKWSPAHAESPDLVRDSLNGLVAFVLPGDDPFSVAQGQTAP